MKLPRIAALFVACSIALIAAAKSKLLQESSSKPAAQQDTGCWAHQRSAALLTRTVVELFRWVYVFCQVAV